MSQSPFHPDFFEFEGITFNRSAIKVISGPTVPESDLSATPYIRIVISDNIEWQLAAPTYEELMTRSTAFITALTT